MLFSKVLVYLTDCVRLSASNNNKTIDISKHTEKPHVFLQVGGNDFFSHAKNGKHFLSVEFKNSKYYKKAFSRLVDDFCWNFSGKVLWILGIFPRYLFDCCPEHTISEQKRQGMFNLVKDINIDLSKKCLFHSKRTNSKFVYIDPTEILFSIGKNWTEALSNDNIHLKTEINEQLANEISKSIAKELTIRFSGQLTPK